MTKYLRRILPFTYILSSILLFAPTSAHAAPSTESIQPIHGMVKDVLRLKASTLKETNFLSSTEFLTYVGSPINNGYALAMARLGTERGYDSYLSLLYNEVSATYVKDTDARQDPAADWLTTYLTILALGGNPSGITNTVTGDTINLLANYTYNYTATKTLYQQGTQTIAYALLAMNGLDYIIPANSTYTREDLIRALLNAQNEDGSFSSPAQQSDTTLTALVVQALAPFYNDSCAYPDKRHTGNEPRSVRSAIKQAISFLSSKQTKEGDIRNGGSATLESTSMTLQACVSIGIDPYHDARFLRSGQTLLDGLAHYQLPDGGFCNIRTKESRQVSDDDSNIQALNGLIAYYRFLHDQRNLYDMREEQTEDTKQMIADLESSIVALEEHPDKNHLTALYKSYCSLPAADRRYVFHYEQLEDAMKRQSLPLIKQDFASDMNQINVGNGYLYNIIYNCEITVSKNFSNKDYDRYADLADPLTLKDYPTITELYCKLANTDSSSLSLDRERMLPYETLLGDMKRKKTGLETTQAKIDQINYQLANKLPSLSQATKKDKELIDQLVYQANCIPEQDRNLITSYEELIKTKERLTPKSLSITSSKFLFFVFVILFSPILLRKKKKGTVAPKSS